MSVRHFYGATNREAMARVRAALGDDALILANRPHENGVEILALAEGEAELIADTPAGEGDFGSRLLREMADVRSLLGARTSRRRQAVRDRLWQRLRAAGFSAALGETLLAALPEHSEDDWLERQLRARLSVAAPGTLDDVRVIALIGPTGVGKTTTAAKLAARYAQTHGPGEVALLSADDQRPGAHYQLRLYAERLGVDLHVVDRRHRLEDLQPVLRDKRWVIIDTTGLSQRDERLAEQAKTVWGGAADVTPVLLLSAASHPDTLDEIACRYLASARTIGARLEEVIVTKQDEAAAISPVLDVLMRHGLRLHYVTGGQRVPEDLEVAAGPALIARALADAPASRSVEAAPWTHHLLNQGRVLGEVLEQLRRQVPGFADLERLWQWQGLPADQWRRRLAMLSSVEASPTRQGAAAMLYWHGNRDGERTGYELDEDGLPVAGGCHRFQSGDWRANLIQSRIRDLDANPDQGPHQAGPAITTHLLPRLPDAAGWRWLTEQGLLWACRARATSRVWHAGQRQPLNDCRTFASVVEGFSLRYRGRAVQAALRYLPVAGDLSGERLCALLGAWFVDLRDPGNGAVVARGYWLSPADLRPDAAIRLIVSQLRGEALPELARHAATLLPPRTVAAADDAASQIADRLSALAVRLEADDREWALELRSRLLNLAGARQQRGPRALLDALVAMLATRDAMRGLIADSSKSRQ